ncbi:MAG TPA: aminotransferase class I/II-fold pyridoxal phosphate-dependent enzyme [Stellaceae bacterium]|nr:aminotransferase class I/II-fold pyridoxal phosphate-dependent enzyme [Stellaceae bacterium]
MNLETDSRLDSVAANPFACLATLLAGVTPKTNEPPIIMSVGEPQHAPPALLAETLAAHADLWNRYPPMAGTLEVRAAAAQWLTNRYHLPPGLVTAERHVLVLAGTKEGLYLAATAIVPERKGGARPLVLLPNPYYLVYFGASVMAGGEPVFLDASAASGFLPDLEAIPADILARTALFYLCSPSNPQGAVADLSYLERAIGLARRHGFALIVDECYAEIYDRKAPPGALEACAGVGNDLDNVLVFHSLSKRSSAAGLRCGFVAGDPRLIARILHLRDYAGSQVPLPVQAAAAALWRDEAHVEANRARYRRKFDVAQSLLAGRFGFYRPEGGFFLWLDVDDGEAAARRLWREGGLRTLPGAYIAQNRRDGTNPGKPYLRLALVHDDQVIEAGLQRMKAIL